MSGSGPGDFDRYLDKVLVGGREQRVIEIVDYAPSWPIRFESERQRIHQALDSVARRIEHVGSRVLRRHG